MACLLHNEPTQFSFYFPTMLKFALFCTLVVAGLAAPNCTETAGNECLKPAVTHFLKRFEDLKTTPLTDEKWAKDLLTQCELDQRGRECLIGYAKECFPKDPLPQTLLDGNLKDFCTSKVNNITSGCAPNSSSWYSKCERPLLDRLHSYLTMKKEPKMEPTKIMRIHKDLCCQIKRYETCIIPAAQRSCKASATEIFRAILDDMFLAYNCNPQIFALCK